MGSSVRWLLAGGMGLLLSGCESTNASRGVRVTVTGEAQSQEGYAFPTAGAGEPGFADGWELRFEHLLVTLGEVHLSQNPDMDPNDQSKTGEKVAELKGPWVFDLAQGGPLDSKEQNGKAFEVGLLPNQNLKNNLAFDLTEKYAFGYSLVAATAEAQGKESLDAEAGQAYNQMVADGATTWMSGTAEFKGQNCASSGTTYDFSRLPAKVRFSLSFKAPVNYLNCVNPELSGEQRGVQAQSNADSVAQITLHFDHPFWEALEEDAPLRWDGLAAQQSAAVGQPGAAEVALTSADLQGVLFQGFTDAQGEVVGLRFCDGAASRSGALSYDPKAVPVSASGGAQGLKDLQDYMTYNLSSFGHLNNDGLCFPARRYPSPNAD